MKKVYICSPYRGDIERNTANARAYCREALDQGCIPVAPHLYFTQFLNEDDPLERQLGLFYGLRILRDCHEIWVYSDPRHATEGMREEINEAVGLGIDVIYKDVHPTTRNEININAHTADVRAAEELTRKLSEDMKKHAEAHREGKAK